MIGEQYKRFLLFAWANYYPEPGLNDVYDSFDTLDEAINCAKNLTYDGYEVFDCDERRSVWNWR